MLHRWFIRLPPPNNYRFECRIPVNNDHTNYCGATMHKKWHTSSRISNTAPLLVMVNARFFPKFYRSFVESIYHSQYRATNEQQLRLHINPDVRECQNWCEYLTNLSQCLG